MPNMSPNVQKNAQDWVRDLRFSNQVNMQTMGVDTDRVTPQLLLASSNKLLSISKGQQEGDPKDSLQFQRFYGPVEYFAERIQKDGGSVARSMLWKATNRGSVDFIGPGSLEPHVNAVFHESNLSQFVDNSSVMESVDTSQKVTRIGEGGVSDEDSVPIEMRLVQPSYYGYIDGVRCYSEDTEIYTKEGWISVKDMTEQTEFATLINGKPQWSKPTSVTRYEYHGKMYGYDSQDVQYLVSPQHKMWVQRETTKRVNGKRTKVWGEFKKLPVEKIHEKFCRVLSAIDVPMEVDETQKWFYLPPVESSKSGQKILKNIEKVDIIDFAAFMGWYLSEGCYSVRQNWPANKGMQYAVHIAQSPKLHPEYYEEIRELIERLPFGAHPQKAAEKKAGMALTIHRKQLCLYCKQFGNSFEKFIPEWIFTAPTKARWAFVDAILKGDGSEQRHLNTVSKRLAQDFARLLFELGQSVRITKQHQSYVSTITGKQAEDIYTVVWHKTQKLQLWPSTRKHRPKSGRGFFTEDYNGYIYCPSVPGGLVYVRRKDASFGIWLSNTAEKSPGVTGFLTKNLQKGTDGKLYQTFINMHTGKPQLVDSQKAARSVVTTDEYLNSNDEYVYALGGPKGVRIVKRQDVDYILPNSDDAWSMSSNTVPMLSGIKAMRLLMGCHHPETPITVIDSNGMTHIVPAKRLASMENIFVFGCNEQGIDCIYPVRKVVTRVPAKKAKFKKIVLNSGRTLLTSAEHKWWVYDKQFHLLQAKDLEEGMKVPRSMFSTMPVIRTAILGAPITPQICTLMGRIIRSLKATNYSYRVTFIRDKESGVDQKKDIEEALKQLNVQGWNIFSSRGMHAVSIKDPVFQDWIDNNIGKDPEDRRIPSELLSLPTGYTSIFLDSYYKDLEEVGENPEGDIWLLNIANPSLRDQLSFMLSKLYTDTIYRDFTKKGKVTRALELVPVSDTLNDIVLETIVKVLDVPAPAVMIDIDCDDHVYAAANGIITHNSKYVSQAVPLQEREAPLVRGLDQASGMDMATKVGKLLGTQWAPKAGMVKAVRDDRIDMVYDDGTTGSVYLYKDLPANAKGWLTNYPKVKAGDKVAEGQLLATSNYTDDNGLLGVGRNLRVGYLSYKGGTYEDGGTISETAAKKLGYTTMYKTDMDKDKSIRTAKHLYVTWKPGQYTKEQLDNIDDEGVVKVGATVNKGDPVILGIRTTEPSPGTLGKRILSDVTEVWEHAHPGVVTDVVNGKNGIKVFAKISAPLEAGDKISGFYGNKMTIAKVLPDDQMPTDAKGRPLEVLFDPLGIVSRCYDSQTEFLTKRGWKKGAEITDKDQLWSFDPKTWKCSWSKQLQTLYKKHYRGLMYGYEGKLANFLVTPGHKVWSKARKGEWEQQQIQDIYNQESYIPIVADPQKEAKATPFKLPTVSVKKHDSATKNEPIEFAPEDFASFLGWYLSQGHYTIDDHGYNTFISQDGDIYPDKCWKIHQLLKRMKLSYSYSNSGKRFRIYGKRLTKYVQQFGKCDQKFIPDWLFKQPSHVKQCFVDALLMGDGKVFTKHKNGKDYTTSAICLTSEILIDQLQALLATMGIASTKHYDGPDKRYPDSKPMWRLGITTIHRQVRNLRDGWYQKFYDGVVYCPTVKTGYVLTRRNGCLACLGNTNPSQLMEVGLGKVAQKIGQPIVVPAFQPKGQSRLQFVKDMMKKYNVPWKEDCKDPQTGRTIKNVYTGVCYYIPLKHIADTKMSARGTAKYSADEVPLGGGEEGSKRLGMLQNAALVGHNAFNFLQEAKLIRGQANSDFWRSLRTGQIPVMPGEPLAHKKFFAHLQASGMNVQRNQEGLKIFALSNKDVNQMAGPRELKTTDTYSQKSFQPIDGGLFGQDVFGVDGDKWGYIQLDNPLPNPAMEEPLARLLNISDREFQAIAAGKGTVKGMKDSNDMKKVLSKMDLQKESDRALLEFKQSSKSNKDKALKRYVAIARMRDQGVRPQEYMLDRIPVLPPKFRPITSHGDLTMVADSNYLYAQLLNARDDLREAVKSGLPEEYLTEGKATLYSKWKELVGLHDPSDVKLRAKDVKGLLKWAMGKSPKCYDDQTQVLTEHGWVSFKCYTDANIKVATVNPATDAFQWQNPTQIIHQPGPGVMVHIQNRYLDSMVTPNHQHYVSLRVGRKKGHVRFEPYKKYRADWLLDHSYRMKIKTAATAFQGNLPKPPLPVANLQAFAQFVGWFIAEGFFHSGSKGLVYIAVKAGGRDDKLLSALYEKMGIPYKRAVYKRNFTVKKGERSSVCNIPEGYESAWYSINDVYLCSWLLLNVKKGAQNKELSRQILEWSPEYLRCLWQGWFRGDGNKYVAHPLKFQNKQTWQNRDSLTDGGNAISTVSRHLVDNLMQIGAKIGVQACVVSQPDTREGHQKPVYRVCLHGFPYVTTQGNKHMNLVPYEGNVHCVTVPNGLVITRRNNRVIVSGNSSAFQQKVLGSTVDTVGRGVVIPSTKIKLNQIGMPVEMAWKLFAPFVTRRLTQQGYSPIDAMQLIKEHKPVAMEALLEEVKARPVVMNRAPSLHKLSLMGFNVKLTNGHAIKVNPSIVVPYGMDFDGNCCDYDSEISLEIAKSTLDKLKGCCSIYQTITNKEFSMATTKETRFEAQKTENNETVYGSIKIGEFPRLGKPVKDKNGADVYKVPEGFKVEACDPITGKRGFYPIEALTVEDDCETVKVTAGNHSVIVSSNESMAVFDTASGKLVKVTPEAAKGKLVPIIKKDLTPFGTQGDRDLGWLIGGLISDGWVTGNVIGYAKLEDSKRAEVERIFRGINPNFLLKEYREQTAEGKNKLGESAKIHIYSPELADFVRQLDIVDQNGDRSKKTACNKQINKNLLMNTTEDFLWGLLSGLLDGDGSIIVNTSLKKPRFGCRYATSSPALRDSFAMLLYRLGIRYSITTTPPRNWSNEAYTICPSTIDIYKNIDKLSCIGEREVALIKQWKEAAPEYEDKKDQVPVSDEEWEIWKTVCNSKSDPGVYSACMQKKSNRSVMRAAILKYRTFLAISAPSLLQRAEEENTLWYPVDSVEDAGKRQVFDLMVSDAKVFAVNNGFVIWDTVNIHVPVSKKAVEDVRQKMMPERNLIGIRDYKVLYKPEKAYVQGLYVATRMGETKDVKVFPNQTEATKAYKRGQIDIDTPIVIKEKQNG